GAPGGDAGARQRGALQMCEAFRRMREMAHRTRHELARISVGRSAWTIVELGTLDVTIAPIGMKRADHGVARLELRDALADIDHLAGAVRQRDQTVRGRKEAVCDERIAKVERCCMDTHPQLA